MVPPQNPDHQGAGRDSIHLSLSSPRLLTVRIVQGVVGALEAQLLDGTPLRFGEAYPVGTDVLRRTKGMQVNLDLAPQWMHEIEEGSDDWPESVCLCRETALGETVWSESFHRVGVFRLGEYGVVNDQVAFRSALLERDAFSQVLVAAGAEKAPIRSWTFLEPLEVAERLGSIPEQGWDQITYSYWETDGRKEVGEVQASEEPWSGLPTRRDCEDRFGTIREANYAIEVELAIDYAHTRPMFSRSVRQVVAHPDMDRMTLAQKVFEAAYGKGTSPDLIPATRDLELARSYVRSHFRVVSDGHRGDRILIEPYHSHELNLITPREFYHRDPFREARIEDCRKRFAISRDGRAIHFPLNTTSYFPQEPEAFTILYGEFGLPLISEWLAPVQLDFHAAQSELSTALRYIQDRYSIKVVQSSEAREIGVFTKIRGGSGELYDVGDEQQGSGVGSDILEGYLCGDFEQLLVKRFPCPEELRGLPGSEEQYVTIYPWLAALADERIEVVESYPVTTAVQLLDGVWYAERNWDWERSLFGASWRPIGAREDLIPVSLTNSEFERNAVVLDRGRAMGVFRYSSFPGEREEQDQIGMPLTGKSGDRFFGRALKHGADAFPDRDKILLPLKRGETKAWVFQVYNEHRIDWALDEGGAYPGEGGSYVIGIRVTRDASDRVTFAPYDNGVIYTPCAVPALRDFFEARLLS